MNIPILKITDLSVNIEGKLILDKISFDVSEGKIITVVGPNGGGKSTLAKCILKLIKPSSGEIWVRNDIKIGYMPQKVSLNLNLPINVITFLKLSVNAKITPAFLTKTIHDIGIQHILSTPLQKISGGEMQKVLLAKALLGKPDLLVLDEPSQGVDINGQLDLYKLITKLCKEKNMSMLIISHDLFMVIKNTDYVICLNQHICCEGTATFFNQQENFQKLFGNDTIDTFSVYKHHHNHVHL